MGSTLSVEYKDAIPCFQLIIDVVVSHKIIILLSIIEIAKWAQQIALENDLLISSTYNKEL
jgi:hypothetical protein